MDQTQLAAAPDTIVSVNITQLRILIGAAIQQATITQSAPTDPLATGSGTTPPPAAGVDELAPADVPTIS